MNILVTGSNGFVGSRLMWELEKLNHKVIGIDISSHCDAKPHPETVIGDIRSSKDLEKVQDIFYQKYNRPIKLIIHCAASKHDFGISREEYFSHNQYGTQVLLEFAEQADIHKIIYISTVSVFGHPQGRADEDTPYNPDNPYGESKRMMEKMMKWVDMANGIKYVSLRYFNVAGAVEDGHIGEAHTTETHLIPIILQVPLGKRDHITVFGTDYPTADGTCIRDYVHVIDLADAHMKALNYLREGNESNIFNLGTGEGFSVKEMIDAAEKATGLKIKVEYGQRRAGDPARLIASSEKAQKILNWHPKYTSMEEIIKTAWKWHQAHPNGYED